MAPGGPSLGLLSGTRWVPSCYATEPPSRSETVLASSMPLWAPASPIYTHTVHGQDTPGSWCRVGWHACGLHSWTAGQCGQWTVGRAARTQESASLRKRVLCTRRVKRPSWVYYVLGAAVKTDQKSRAAQRHCWDLVGIRENI